MVLLAIGFLAGVITAISPCVLPVLPILLAGGASGGGRLRALAIVAGLVASFTTFTLAGAWLLDRLGLPADTLRNVAIAALLLLAATLLWPWLGHQLERPFYRLTRRRVGADANGFVLGISLGLVFVPCAGPVLAAVTALSAAGELGIRSVAVTLAYAAGAAVPMLLIALGSQRLASGVRLLRTHASATRRVAGAMIGITALAIALGADTRFSTALPGYTQALQERVEGSAAAQEQLAALAGGEAPGTAGAGRRAPEFAGILEWLNTPRGAPLSLARLRGRVVLVDFWTYSCINCLRTLPHLKAWDAAYRRAGLTIVGVHSPEFAFERVPANVRDAVHDLGIRYPVALDNDFATWNAYANRYWPAKYLIDRTGRVRDTHFGEGDYEQIEAAIRRLLGEGVPARRTTVADRTPRTALTPETYLGYARMEGLANAAILRGEARYVFPPALGPNQFAFAGRWRIGEQAARAGRDARLRLRFQARRVFLVLSGQGRVGVSLDGRPQRAVDVRGTPRLYTVLARPSPTRGLLELRFPPGVAGWAFTFG